MAGLQNGPPPSKLCLLSDLGTFSAGDKVRFLGCVTNYSTKTAVLTLEHNHPPKNEFKALVDIRLLLESIKAHESRIGEWVHVMGYIGALKQSSSSLLSTVKTEIPVQAIVLWSAGPLRLDKYEELQDKLKAERLNDAHHVP